LKNLLSGFLRPGEAPPRFSRTLFIEGSRNSPRRSGRSAEIAVIHRRIQRLDEQGARRKPCWFPKEIDHALERIATIEKHLGINKKIAA
jgi:hypothetical protein